MGAQGEGSKSVVPVAQGPDEKISVVKRDEWNNSRLNGTTSLFSLLNELQLFPSFSGNYSPDGEVQDQEIVPLLRELLAPRRWKILKYYFKHGAATLWILRYGLNMTKTTAYRWHTLLEVEGLVEQKTTIKPIDKMRRPATVWGLPSATNEQVKKAYQHHCNLISPKYRAAVRHAENYNHLFGDRPISRRQLVDYLKSVEVEPRMRSDLAQIMEPILNEKGVKAWE